MSPRLLPGSAATLADLWVARRRRSLLATELPRVRANAAAWRNGLAGLLTALIGFSLIRGRSDIGQLAASWAIAVGALLLAALAAGAVGALSLIRAANGRLTLSDAAQLLPAGLADHFEALASITALRRGVVSTLTCAALLVTAVAVTWYGPDRRPPQLKVTLPGLVICGAVVRIDRGVLVLRGRAGEVTVELGQAETIEPVSACDAK